MKFLPSRAKKTFVTIAICFTDKQTQWTIIKTQFFLQRNKEKEHLEMF